MCIVTLNLQKREKLVLERFAAHECRIKLFQVSAANGSPKAALILSMPASPPAVHLLPVGGWQLPRLADSGRTP